MRVVTTTLNEKVSTHSLVNVNMKQLSVAHGLFMIPCTDIIICGDTHHRKSVDGSKHWTNLVSL